MSIVYGGRGRPGAMQSGQAAKSAKPMTRTAKITSVMTIHRELEVVLVVVESALEGDVPPMKTVSSG